MTTYSDSVSESGRIASGTMGIGVGVAKIGVGGGGIFEEADV